MFILVMESREFVNEDEIHPFKSAMAKAGSRGQREKAE